MQDSVDRGESCVKAWAEAHKLISKKKEELLSTASRQPRAFRIRASFRT
jgi:hypothetical protein